LKRQPSDIAWSKIAILRSGPGIDRPTRQGHHVWVSRILIAAVGVACCAAPAAAGPAPGSLRGVVTIGPTTPVCRVGEPCTKPASGVVLTFTRGPHRVATRTDSGSGRYRVRLAAGTWSVHASVGMRIEPATVKVAAARTSVRNLSIDTGIR
jgi:hypothetical protein